MLPSVEAFLNLWDTPVEFVEIQGKQIAGVFHATVVIEAPCNPLMKIKMHPMKIGES